MTKEKTMPTKDLFQGFSTETVKFFKDLAKNNNKRWFDEHRTIYDDEVIAPARDFVYDMGKRMKKIAPWIVADPRVNKSLFRINRDTRFSKDKTPYKTNMGIWFWEGKGARMDNTGFYFHLEMDKLYIGAGMYQFPKHLLSPYREAVAAGGSGVLLTRAANAVQGEGYKVGGEHYKRVPRGFDADHKRADLLKYNGLFAGLEVKIPKEFYSAELLDWCMVHYKAMLPIHKWLLKLTQQSASK